MAVPKETFPGFIYLDLNHPLVAWECYRGTLISSYVDASNNAQTTSLRVAGLIHGSNINFANELLFDHIRSQYFPSAVSRLRCLYAFDNRKCAESVTSWGGHFTIENLVDVGVSANNLTRADANWITYAKRENGLIKESYIPHIHDYWRGIPYPNEQPQWECLIDGYAIVWGTEHKNKAYQIIREQMPDVLGLLEISRIAETMGFYLGHIYPRIFRINHSDFKLAYLIDMHDLKDNYGNFIEQFEKYQGPVNQQDFKQLFNENDVLKYTVPDLREYEKTFSLSDHILYGLSSLKIHSI
ncbi:MAG: DUF2441 domain-containing protein [Gammaproteobacteria bacterium]|nr:DUF2441 domain-containing protein [Gammaproteobacteria bacterium]